MGELHRKGGSIRIGAGLTVVFFAAPIIWPTIPTYLSWPALGIGGLILISGLVAKVREIFGTAAKELLPDDITSAAVLDYLVAASKWGSKYRRNDLVFAHAADEFRRAAERGEITIQGRPRHRSDYETIPRLYWKTAQLDLIDHMSPDSVCRTEEKELLANIQIYEGLITDKKQVEKTWPRKRWQRLLSFRHA